MRDTPLGNGANIFGTWQGGLRFASGAVKAGGYSAYPLPFFVRLLGPGAGEGWGAARPGGAGAVVQVEQRRGGGAFHALGGRLTVSNVRGYFRKRFLISKAAHRTYRFKYLVGSATFTSRRAKAAIR